MHLYREHKAPGSGAFSPRFNKNMLSKKRNSRFISHVLVRKQMSGLGLKKKIKRPISIPLEKYYFL